MTVSLPAVQLKMTENSCGHRVCAECEKHCVGVWLLTSVRGEPPMFQGLFPSQAVFDVGSR